MRSFVALSVVLATSSAVFASPSNVSLNTRDLVARQATTTPTACQAQCEPASNQLGACSTDMSCMCGASLSKAYHDCLQCGYNEASADVGSQLQGAWQSYVDACKQTGNPVSDSSTLTGSSSSSSSSTGTNSGTNTNSNTGTNTNSNTGSSNGLKSNDASRSAGLGFIGLGALALAVSSLF